ncbi:MAG: GspE/PulE family protein [Spirochaetaceae bacterium]
MKRLLSTAYCRRWKISLLRETAQRVELAAAAPLPLEEADRLESYFGKPVSFTSVSEETLLLSEAARLSGEAGGIAPADVGEDERGNPEAPAVIVSRALMIEAANRNASDLHLHLSPEELSCFLRIDGVLERHLSFPPALGAAVIRRLLALAGLDPFSLDTSQEGRLTLTIDATPHDLRLSLLRRGREEISLALRLFPPREKRPCVAEIIPHQATRGKLERLASLQRGLLLFCGPTGSGKSTTVHALLLEEAKAGRRVVTLEDPVEQQEPAFLQLDLKSIAEARGVLEAALRQDPDILVLGEVRNGETLAWAVEAALTGHLVLTTLHVSSIESAVDRLLELGAPEAALREVLRGVITQRLVPALRPPDPSRRLALLSVADLDQTPLDVPRLTGEWWRRYLRRSGYISEGFYRKEIEALGYRLGELS